MFVEVVRMLNERACTGRESARRGCVSSTNEGSESASCDQKLASPGLYSTLIKKKRKIFLIYKEMQVGFWVQSHI